MTLIAACLIALVLWQAPRAPTGAIAPGAPGTRSERHGTTLKGTDADRLPASIAVEAEVCKPSPAPTDSASPDAYPFSVVFQALDDLGRPMPEMEIDAALGEMRPNHMGRTDRDGKLVLNWRSGAPSLDLEVAARRNHYTSLWQRVHLHTDQTILVHIDAGDVWGRASSGVAPAQDFSTDSTGNGVITDEDLLVKLAERDAVRRPSIPSPFGRRRLGNAHGIRPRASTRIQVSARDLSGHPLSAVAVYIVSNEPPQPVGTTDSRGMLVVERTGPGTVVLGAGGGLFSQATNSFQLAEGAELEWSVIVDAVPAVSGRLRDSRGLPLAGWRIDARQDEPPFGFLGAVRSDDQGEFAIGLAEFAHARLSAVPQGSDLVPCVIIDHVLPDTGHLDVEVNQATLVAGATWSIDLPATDQASPPEARLVRADSGEGVTLLPSKSTQTEPDRRTWTFRLNWAVPGRYSVTDMGGGGVSTFTLDLPSSQQNLGLITAEQGVEIDIAGLRDADSTWSARATHRLGGFHVRSPELQQVLRMLAAPGESDLVVSDGTVQVRRTIHARTGERIRISRDDLH